MKLTVDGDIFEGTNWSRRGSKSHGLETFPRQDEEIERRVTHRSRAQTSTFKDQVHRVQLYMRSISRNLLIEVFHWTHSVCCFTPLILVVRMEALSFISYKP